MKQIKIFLMTVMMMVFTGISVSANTVVTVSTDILLINGEQKEIDIFKGEMLNFVRVTDIAYLLKGTTSQFDVKVNVEKNRIDILTDKAYGLDGISNNRFTQVSNLRIEPKRMFIYVDGKGQDFNDKNRLSGSIISMSDDLEEVIFIEGEAFINLRKLSSLVGFDLGYIASQRAITISTNENEAESFTTRWLQEYLKTGVTKMYSLALDNDGNLWAWIEEDNLTNGITSSIKDRENLTLNERTKPEIIMKDVIDFSSTGLGQTFIVTKDQTLWGVGFNENGELGDGTKENRFEPVKLLDNISKVDTMNVSYLNAENADRPIEFTRGSATFVITTDHVLYGYGVRLDENNKSHIIPVAKLLENIQDIKVRNQGGVPNNYRQYEIAILTIEGEVLTIQDNIGETATLGLAPNGEIIDTDLVVSILDDVKMIGIDSAIKNNNELWTWGFSGTSIENIQRSGSRIIGYTQMLRKEPKKEMDNVQGTAGDLIVDMEGNLYQNRVWTFNELNMGMGLSDVIRDIRKIENTDSGWMVSRGTILRKNGDLQEITNISSEDSRSKTATAEFKDIIISNIQKAERYDITFSLGRLPE